MKITFLGPAGRSVTIADPRRAAAGNGTRVELPQPERRPAGWIIGSYVVATMKV
jgi:hypothetical protein